MTAREKARATKLRRASEETFTAEAMRRGFVLRGKRAMVDVQELECTVDKLASIVSTLVDGGDLFYCVRATRAVELKLRDYVAAYKPRPGQP